ncbi:hypothetical protein SDC9_208212 [bioreactor metagenome]|uniref:Uncharacterized protein n=1 Tax=bioreactor metagenome TaxID=1076179 RepID=A0A645JJG2_9ZZZZ
MVGVSQKTGTKAGRVQVSQREQQELRSYCICNLYLKKHTLQKELFQ